MAAIPINVKVTGIPELDALRARLKAIADTGGSVRNALRGIGDSAQATQKQLRAVNAGGASAWNPYISALKQAQLTQQRVTQAAQQTAVVQKQLAASSKMAADAQVQAAQRVANANRAAIAGQRQQIYMMREQAALAGRIGNTLLGLGGAGLYAQTQLANAQKEVGIANARLRGTLTAEGRPQDFGALKQTAYDVAKQSGQPTVVPTMNAATTLVRAGVETKEVDRLLKDMQRQADNTGASVESISKAFARAFNTGRIDLLNRTGLHLSYAATEAIKAAAAHGRVAMQMEIIRQVEMRVESSTGKLGSTIQGIARDFNQMQLAFQAAANSDFGKALTSSLTKMLHLVTWIFESISKWHSPLADDIGVVLGWLPALALVAGGVFKIYQMWMLVKAGIQAVALWQATLGATGGAAAAGGAAAGGATAATAGGAAAGWLAPLPVKIAIGTGIATKLGFDQFGIGGGLQRMFQPGDYNRFHQQMQDALSNPSTSQDQKLGFIRQGIERYSGTNYAGGVEETSLRQIYQKMSGREFGGVEDQMTEQKKAAEKIFGKDFGGFGADDTAESVKAASQAKKDDDKRAEQAARENAAMLDASARERAETEKAAARDEAERIREAHRESRERDHEDLRRQIQEYEDAHKRTREADLNSAKGMLLLRNAGYNLPQILMAQRMEKIVRGAAGDEVSGETRRHVQEMRNAGRWRDIADARALHQELAEVQGRHGMAAAEDVYAARMAGAHGKAAGVTRARAGGALGVAQARYGASGAQTGPSQYANGHIKVPVTITIEDPVARHARRVRR